MAGGAPDNRLRQTETLPNLRFPDEGFSTVPAQQAYLQDAARTLEQLPGVVRVGHASSWPIGGSRTAVERHDLDATSGVTGLFTLCNAEFFDTLALVATHGRLLTDADVARASRVVVVNQALATRLFGDTDPLGHAVRLPGVDELSTSGTETRFEIVGVVPDVRNAPGLRSCRRTTRRPSGLRSG